MSINANLKICYPTATFPSNAIAYRHGLVVQHTECSTSDNSNNAATKPAHVPEMMHGSVDSLHHSTSRQVVGRGTRKQTTRRDRSESQMAESGKKKKNSRPQKPSGGGSDDAADQKEPVRTTSKKNTVVVNVGKKSKLEKEHEENREEAPDWPDRTAVRFPSEDIPTTMKRPRSHPENLHKMDKTPPAAAGAATQLAQSQPDLDGFFEQQKKANRSKRGGQEEKKAAVITNHKKEMVKKNLSGNPTSKNKKKQPSGDNTATRKTSTIPQAQSQPELALCNMNTMQGESLNRSQSQPQELYKKKKQRNQQETNKKSLSSSKTKPASGVPPQEEAQQQPQMDVAAMKKQKNKSEKKTSANDQHVTPPTTITVATPTTIVVLPPPPPAGQENPRRTSQPLKKKNNKKKSTSIRDCNNPAASASEQSSSGNSSLSFSTGEQSSSSLSFQPQQPQPDVSEGIGNKDDHEASRETMIELTKPETFTPNQQQQLPRRRSRPSMQHVHNSAAPSSLGCSNKLVMQKSIACPPRQNLVGLLLINKKPRRNKNTTTMGRSAQLQFKKNKKQQLERRFTMGEAAAAGSQEDMTDVATSFGAEDCFVSGDFSEQMKGDSSSLSLPSSPVQPAAGSSRKCQKPQKARDGGRWKTILRASLIRNQAQARMARTRTTTDALASGMIPEEEQPVVAATPNRMDEWNSSAKEDEAFLAKLQEFFASDNSEELEAQPDWVHQCRRRPVRDSQRMRPSIVFNQSWRSHSEEFQPILCEPHGWREDSEH